MLSCVVPLPFPSLFLLTYLSHLFFSFADVSFLSLSLYLLLFYLLQIAYSSPSFGLFVSLSLALPLCLVAGGGGGGGGDGGGVKKPKMAAENHEAKRMREDNIQQQKRERDVQLLRSAGLDIPKVHGVLRALTPVEKSVAAKVAKEQLICSSMADPAPAHLKLPPSCLRALSEAEQSLQRAWKEGTALLPPPPLTASASAAASSSSSSPEDDTAAATTTTTGPGAASGCVRACERRSEDVLLLALKTRMEAKQEEDVYAEMQQQRQRLPAHATKQTILDTLRENRVVVISGETGCGKTTQVI
jgi:HrpA-like RNA helicase